MSRVYTKELLWYKRANCRDMDTNLFFPEDGHNITQFTREVCQLCDVRMECLNYALRNNIEYGVWGGTSPNQRRGMRHVYTS